MNRPYDTDQIDRFKGLVRELRCDEDEAVFDAALKKVAEAEPLPKHEPKKRAPQPTTGSPSPRSRKRPE